MAGLLALFLVVLPLLLGQGEWLLGTLPLAPIIYIKDRKSRTHRLILPGAISCGPAPQNAGPSRTWAVVGLVNGQTVSLNIRSLLGPGACGNTCNWEFRSAVVERATVDGQSII